jgi:hypothetical protein
MIGLALEIAKIHKGSERPEIVADVMDDPFLDLAFFLWRSRIAGAGGDLQLAEEIEEAML